MTVPLPVWFTPSDHDVICGRARENFHHEGNRRFRELINKSIGPYLAAKTKFDKSEAIAKIVFQVQAANPCGGFIKREARTGRWYKLKDAEARDKVGHAIRKAVQRYENIKPKALERMRKQSESHKPTDAPRSGPSPQIQTPKQTPKTLLSDPGNDRKKTKSPILTGNKRISALGMPLAVSPTALKATLSTVQCLERPITIHTPLHLPLINEKAKIPPRDTIPSHNINLSTAYAKLGLSLSLEKQRLQDIELLSRLNSIVPKTQTKQLVSLMSQPPASVQTPLLLGNNPSLLAKYSTGLRPSLLNPLRAGWQL